DLFESLSRAPKQLDAVMAYFHLNRSQQKISKTELMESSGCGHSALTALVNKEVFSIREEIVSRIAEGGSGFSQDIVLSDEQQRAFDEIKEGFINKEIALLYGVTASGKTEIYIKLIQ